MWTDTHLHFTDTKFAEDREAVYTRAREAGVSQFVEIGEDPKDWEAAATFSAQHEGVALSLGVHPHFAREVGNPEAWAAHRTILERLKASYKVSALGEMGLDYYRMPLDADWPEERVKESQEFLFRAQLELAREWKLPGVIHCRDAHEDCVRIVSDYFAATELSLKIPVPAGVIHCFTGEWPHAQEYQSRGFMLGIDGPVTYPSSKLLQTIVRQLSVERIVLETDAPYLPPQSHRGQRNEPQFIPVIGDKVGELKRMETEKIAAHTTDNARRLFRL